MATNTLIEGLCFAEGPRWHEGRLWFSDMHDYKVLATDMDGNMETIAEVPEQPSGLGWLPDGRLLIVSMLDRKLLVQEDGKLSEFASLCDLATYHGLSLTAKPPPGSLIKPVQPEANGE